MKHKALINLVIFTVAIIFATSCKKDDSSASINSIKMDGSNFSVASASMIGISIGDDGHTGITLVSGSAAQAKTLSIDVESFTKETIEGDYAYPEVSNKKRLDDWLTNYSVFSGTSVTSTNLKSGDVSVSNNEGNNYTIKLNLTMEDGVTFIGEYTGEFQVMFSNQ